MLGAVCGDILGSRHEFNPTKQLDFELFSPIDRWTDDTVCTIAIADALLNNQSMEKTMVDWVQSYSTAGYGMNFLEWAFNPERAPYGSWGNGAAMRVSSCAWLGNSMEECLMLAEQSAKFSHDHYHGIVAAKATTAAIRMALEGWTKDEIKQFVQTRFHYNLGRTPDSIRPKYRFEVASHRSVPEALCCFLHGNSWEEVIRLCISLGGDADTQAAIAGAAAEPLFGIPDSIKEHALSRLDSRMMAVWKQFHAHVQDKVYSRSSLDMISPVPYQPIKPPTDEIKAMDQWEQLHNRVSGIKSSNETSWLGKVNGFFDSLKK